MSITPTTVRLYTTLWEGDVVERVTYQLYNRNITIDKLPRTLLEKYKTKRNCISPVSTSSRIPQQTTPACILARRQNA